jgi:hypothetical protein
MTRTMSSIVPTMNGIPWLPIPAIRELQPDRGRSLWRRFASRTTGGGLVPSHQRYRFRERVHTFFRSDYMARLASIIAR